MPPCIETPLYTLVSGDTPLLVHVPHAGTRVPGDMAARFTGVAGGLPDTDWFVDRLYAFAVALGAGLMAATHSRYVIDLNRPPDDAALYATRGTGLVPLETFDGAPVYQQGAAPDAAEIASRHDSYWQPHHDALAAELSRLRRAHGHVVLLDAHSIRSQVPALFEGRLPDLNLGSNAGASADASLVAAAMDILSSDTRWSHVLDGRFKGGYITRHYGRPGNGMHALQLEMAQSVYMDEDARVTDEHRMQDIRGLLVRLLQALIDWQPAHG